MFPKAASSHVRHFLQDAAHDMDEILEVKGHALLPGLDVVCDHLCSKQVVYSTKNDQKGATAGY